MLIQLRAFPVLRLGITVPPLPISFPLVLAPDGRCVQSHSTGSLFFFQEAPHQDPTAYSADFGSHFIIP